MKGSSYRRAMLNHTGQSIRSPALNTWTATTFVLLLAPTLLLTPTVTLADQTGGTVVTGSGSITQSSKITTINQDSQTLGLTWDTFNINADQTVNFVQPNAKALAVNRILDTNGSRILGNLNANGQVWLINPNGVFFGAGSQINVGSILASTLNPLGDPNDLSNSGDINQIFGNGGTGSVINQGTITAANGGYVAMLGNKVINEGVITAKLGTVALGAGSQVSLQFNDSKLLKLAVDQSTLDNLADNQQLIKADGGLVLMSAGAKASLLASTVNNSGIIEAHTVENKDGKIILMGGMAAGTTYVAGTLDASASSSNNTGTADGGFIETSAAYVKVDDDAIVTTHAENGETGTWLIDPVDFTVAATGGDMTGAAVNTALASNNFQIESTSGASGTAGDININDLITWSSNNNLTLTAQNDININQDITATGATAKLNLEYGQANVAAGNASTYNLDAKINLEAGDNFSTKLGSDGATIEYKVITSLGAEGSTTGTDLQGINGNLSGNYVLGADIDASITSGWNSGEGFDPLGDNATEFTGIFDGLNHTVSNLTINRPSSNYMGLFGYTDGATIRNVGMMSDSVTGKRFVGGLVGYNTNNSIISNSYATGDATGEFYVGGLVGYNFNGSTVSNSYATGNVTSTTTNTGYTGGLVGYNDNSSINNSYATGSVTAAGRNTGGLVGDNDHGGSISNSYATGAVTSTNQFTGGLVGLNDSSGSISNSYATGVVTGPISSNSNTGGLVGGNLGTVSNSYYANTTGQTDTGRGLRQTIAELAAALPTGFDSSVWGNADNQTTPYLLSHAHFDSAGPVYLSTDSTAATPYQAIINIHQLQAISNALSANYVLGDDIDASSTSGWNNGDGFDPLGDFSTRFTGTFNGLNHTINNLFINRPLTNDVGLFGYTDGATIRNVGMVGGSVTGYEYVGGLVGYSDNSSTVSNSYATGDVTGENYVGGLVGNNDSSNISNSYATGTVSGDNNIGGLAGLGNGTISNSYATGDVTGNSFVGGLVGYNDNSTSNSYATGDVTGNSFVGGLVGLNDKSISNSYATGSVAGISSVGGLVGFNNSTVSNSFWNTDTSNQNSSAGGIGRTTAEMQTLSTFTGAGWDIDDVGGTGKVWRIYEGHTSPLLRSFMNQLDLSGADTTVTYNGNTQTITLPTGFDVNLIQGGLASAKDAGTYNSTGVYSSQQGYDITGSATLTINKADATVTANSNTVTYNGLAQTVTGFSATGLVNSETASVLSSVSTSGGTGTNAGSYTHTASGTDTNYNLTFVDGALTIDKANATVTANSNTVTYNGLAQAVTGFSATGLVNSETESVLSGVSTSGGSGTNAGSYTHTASGTGTNYNLTFVDGSLTIDKATLTYNATPTSITAGTTPTLTGDVTGFVAGESLASATTGNTSWNTAGDITQPGSYDITGSGLAAQNYDFTQNVINATALTVNGGATPTPTVNTRSIPDAIETTSTSLLPTKVPTVTQTLVNIYAPSTGADGESINSSESDLINDPQSQINTIDVVYISCDDKDKNCSS